MTRVFDCYANTVYRAGIIICRQVLIVFNCLLVPHFDNITLYKTSLKQVIGSCLKAVNDMCLERFSKDLSKLHLCEAQEDQPQTFFSEIVLLLLFCNFGHIKVKEQFAVLSVL